MDRPHGVERRQNIKLSVDEKADHAISVYDYPELGLDVNEYILIDVERTKLFPVLAHIIAALGYVGFAAVAFLDVTDHLQMSENSWFSLLCLFVVAIVAMICYCSVWVYNKNRLIVSNQRIFNKIQPTLFSYSMQSIELEHIEDISYSQNGIMANIFNYGSIRFSTVGNEHTYELSFVSSPGQQIKIIKKAVHDVDEGEATKFNAKSVKS